MEKLGYILSEVIVLILVMGLALGLVRYRRYRSNQPPVSDDEKQLLFNRSPGPFGSPIFRLRLARAILAATAATGLLFTLLAPFGAAITTGALIVTGAAIVRWFIIVES